VFLKRWTIASGAMLDFWPRRKTEHSKDAEDSNTEDTTFLDSKSKKIPDRYQGWRFGVLTCTASTCLVLLINISLALGALGKNGWGRDGQPVLYEGKCNTVGDAHVRSASKTYTNFECLPYRSAE
jgi:hypothetical protein